MGERAARWDFDRLLNQLLVVVAVGVIGHLIYAVYANDIDALRAMVHFRPEWIALGYLSMVAIWFSHAAEISVWGHLFGIRMSFHDSVKIAMATDLGVAATPTFVGGGPIKVSMLMKKGFRSDQAATVLAMNPIADVLFFVVFIPVSIFVGRKRYDAGWILSRIDLNTLIHGALIFAGVVVLLFLLRFWWMRRKGKSASSSGSWRHRMANLFRRIGGNFRFIAREGRGSFFLCLFFTAGKWLFRFAALVCLVRGLGVEADLLVVFFFQWMVYVAMMFFPTPGATGGAEFAFYTVFKSVIPLIDLVMLGWRMLTYYLVMLTAAGYLLFIRWKDGRII